jgi:hypothetical protein
MSLRTHSLPPSSLIPPPLRYQGGSVSSVNNYLIGLSHHQINHFCCTVCAFDIHVSLECLRLFNLAFGTSLTYFYVCVEAIRLFSLAVQLISHAINICMQSPHYAKSKLCTMPGVSAVCTHTDFMNSLQSHQQPSNLSTARTHPTNRRTNRVRNNCANKRSSLSCGLLNSRSVCNKSESILEYIAHHNLNLLIVTEAWLTGTHEYDKMVIKACSPPLFNAISWPRTHKRGGGLLILYDEMVRVKKIELETKFDLNAFEIGIFQIQNENEHNSITCCVIYRPPASKISSFFTNFTKLCQDLLRYKRIILMGDFNLPQNQFDEDSQFSSILTSFSLVQLVKEATHESGHILDLLIIRSEDELNINHMKVVEGVADHCGVLFDMITTVMKNPQSSPIRKTRRFHLFNKDEFCVSLHDNVVLPLLRKFASSKNIWEPLPDTKSEDFLKEMNELLVAELDKVAPLSSCPTRRQKKVAWWNNRCTMKKRELRRLEKAWRKTRLTVNRQIFTNARNDYHKILNAERNAYIKQSIIKCGVDSKKNWNLVNNLLGRKKVVLLPDSPRSLLVSQFNNYFKEKIVKIRESISPTSIVDCPRQFRVSQPLTSFDQVTGADLVNVLRTMNIKSNKLDILPHWLFKSTAQVLLPLLVCFVNSVLRKGLPSVYKHAIITPLLKSNSLDSNDVKNYRPVSNFPTLVKIIEKVVAAKLTHHLEANGLIDPYQSAYRQHFSCETAIISILNDIYVATDRKEISIAVLLDMSAAFDTIDHNALITKLESMGVVDEALEWMVMYLNGRTHSTQIDDITSSPVPLSMGVPQGSVLGPLLFTLYIRELGEVIKDTGVRYNIYADDVQLLVHCKLSELSSALVRIGECLKKIQLWTSNNFLQLNPAKTEFIIFGSKDQLKKIDTKVLIVNNECFQPKSVVRNLGVFLDSQLKFSKHIDNICRSAYANLRMLQSLRRSLTNCQFGVLAHALVLSRIESTPAVLYGVEEGELKRLQRVIKATFRITFGFKRRDHIQYEMKKRGWLTIKQRISMRLMLILHNVISCSKPDYLKQLITFSSGDHGLRSQSRGDLASHGSKTKKGSRSFIVAAPKIWKSIDVATRQIVHRGAFRSAVKKLLTEDE